MFRATLVLFALPLLASGCIVGKTCNNMYAPDNLEIDLNPPVSDEGAWVVTLSGDLDATCTVSLPVADDGFADCDLEGVDLLISEDRLAIEGVSLFDHAPEAITLTMSFEGVEVLSEDIAPDYAIDEPNGEGCGERRSAVVVVDVP